MIVQYLASRPGHSATRSEIIKGIGKTPEDKSAFKAVRRMVADGKLTEGFGKVVTLKEPAP